MLNLPEQKNLVNYRNKNMGQQINLLNEINCVKNFLSNSNIVFTKEKVISVIEQNNVADVVFGYKKFQIVFADFELQKAMNTAVPDQSGTKMVNFGGSRQDIWRKYIVEPIKKKNKYGKSANGVILLIDSCIEPPWLKEDLRIAKKRG